VANEGARVVWGNGCINPLLRAVDAVETDAFSVVVVQDFNGVAVKDGDHGAGEVGNGQRGNEQEQKETDR
jgi:hypothetical protein